MKFEKGDMDSKRAIESYENLLFCYGRVGM
jgi:hypothetical protein